MSARLSPGVAACGIAWLENWLREGEVLSPEPIIPGHVIFWFNGARAGPWRARHGLANFRIGTTNYCWMDVAGEEDSKVFLEILLATARLLGLSTYASAADDSHLQLARVEIPFAKFRAFAQILKGLLEVEGESPG